MITSLLVIGTQVAFQSTTLEESAIAACIVVGRMQTVVERWFVDRERARP